MKSGSDAVPMTMARAVREVQAATRPEAIVVTGAGLPQGMVKQRWVTREPRTHITSGGFSTMGFTLPAAIGAQLARPDAQVLAVCGDGDFLQTMQELAAAAMLGAAGLHGRPRQLGLDQHQGRAADALRPHRGHRLPARRRAVLAGLRGHRPRVRHPRRTRRGAR